MERSSNKCQLLNIWAVGSIVEMNTDLEENIGNYMDVLTDILGKV
jgi:hypothetical protein